MEMQDFEADTSSSSKRIDGRRGLKADIVLLLTIRGNVSHRVQGVCAPKIQDRILFFVKIRRRRTPLPRPHTI